MFTKEYLEKHTNNCKKVRKLAIKLAKVKDEVMVDYYAKIFITELQTNGFDLKHIKKALNDRI